MYKALIIGCGNIGAMYDFETESVSTYAKAFHLDPEIIFEVYDIDPKASIKVAERYGVRCVYELNPDTYKEYDIAVICTPTFTHHEYLSKILEQGPRLVICEKPVDTNPARLEKIRSLYRTSDTKVLVNFFRRFQPGIIQLKKEIEDILVEERCTNIVVTYQRGFHNNASHAIDLLEFLFGATIDLSEAKVSHCVCDEFDADPTLSVSCVFNDANLQFVGLAHAEFSHFDISIYFQRSAVFLKNGCDEIEISSASTKQGNYYPKLVSRSRQIGVVENYMINVVACAKKILEDEEEHDNFLGSIGISERILKLKESRL